MNSRTKIVVIHMRELIIAAILIIVAIIITCVVLISGVSGNKTDDTSGNKDNKKTSTTTNSDNVINENTISDSLSETSTYIPGVYSASVSLDGNPVDIQVTLDKYNINSIELVQVSDAVTTMYPLIETNFEEIANLVMQNGGTKNITFSSENKYTYSMLLNAIEKALAKGR